MNSHMPEQVKFIFKFSDKIVQRLIVFFLLHSKEKNDFTIGPLVTDMQGEIVLTKESVNRVVALNKEQFPMDYDGYLNDCDLLSVIVESRAEIEGRVKRLVEYYPDEASELLELLNEAENNKASFREDIRLPTSKELVEISLG